MLGQFENQIPGSDGIYPRLLSEAREKITWSLTKTYVSSQATGTVAEDWGVVWLSREVEVIQEIIGW